MMTLKCSRCEQELDACNFDKRKNSKSGFSSYCKECRREYAREYAAKRKNDPDYVQRRKKAKNKYRASPKGKAKDKEYREEYRSVEHNQEQEKEYGQRYYYQHKQKRLAAAVKWRKNNPESIKEHTKRAHTKRQANPVYRFADKIRRSVKRACKQKGLLKHGMTFELLGYSPDEVYKHLVQYLGNPCKTCGRGEISIDFCHLDHIIPVVTATTLPDVIELNDLKNLRLICPECNMKKGVKDEHSWR